MSAQEHTPVMRCIDIRHHHGAEGIMRNVTDDLIDIYASPTPRPCVEESNVA